MSKVAWAQTSLIQKLRRLLDSWKFIWKTGHCRWGRKRGGRTWGSKENLLSWFSHWGKMRWLENVRSIVCKLGKMSHSSSVAGSIPACSVLNLSFQNGLNISSDQLRSQCLCPLLWHVPFTVWAGIVGPLTRGNFSYFLTFHVLFWKALNGNGRNGQRWRAITSDPDIQPSILKVGKVESSRWVMGELTNPGALSNIFRSHSKWIT